LAILVAMWLAAALAWPAAPDEIPVHWGIDGRVDRYGGRAEGLLFAPAIATGLYALLLLLPRIDPGRARYAEFRGAYALLRTAVLVMLGLVDALVLLVTFGVAVDVALLLPLVVGALFVVLGLVMPRLRRNWFAGIRTPWTLTSERSWTLTHRHGRWVFVLGGIAIAAAGAGRSAALLVTAFAIFAAGTAWLVLHSYLIWRSDAQRESDGAGRQS